MHNQLVQNSKFWVGCLAPEPVQLPQESVAAASTAFSVARAGDLRGVKRGLEPGGGYSETGVREGLRETSASRGLG